MAKKNKNIFKYLIEMFIVAFGVFLGIIVSDWRTQRKMDRNVDKTLGYIIEEIKTNKKKLESMAKYHAGINHQFDSISSLFTEEDLGMPYLNHPKFFHMNLKNWRGVGITRIDKIVFEGAKINGVFGELDISTIQLISSLYQQSDEYNKVCEATLNKFFLTDNKATLSDIAEIFELMKYDMSMTEINLINTLNREIKHIEEIREKKLYRD